MKKINKKMEETLLKLKKFNRNEILNIRFKELIELLYPSFVQVYDCIIISKKSSAELESSFLKEVREGYPNEKALYEYDKNETLINLCFEEKISRNASIIIGLKALKAWGAILKQIEPRSKFWMVLSCDRKYVMLRFHKLRMGEEFILGEIDDIDQPVYCELIE
ncbi:hypothetical protein [Fusobacterium sp. PH5-44]|uniref:hypothetical protein n=1 Tax=unclassified Fusobacterium TaxID=2648384 RepID=UPI003D1B811F